ncbi:MAG: UvrD-helicase domain-containing protein [Synechococcaceae cyanobacterium]
MTAATSSRLGAEAPFEANAFPLDPGIRLLEASAGTGKTFALAHLVLRLVSEGGHRIRSLLVVTFTEAAAAELRDRIATRLQQALSGLEGRPGWQPPDRVLADWLARQPDPEIRRRWLGQLLLALEELDGADITTIHGFCRRSLARQALQAGLPPQLPLETDPEPLLAQVAHDYWQMQVLALPLHLLAGLRRAGLSPEALREVLRQLDGDPALELEPLPAAITADTGLADLLPPQWLRWRERFLARWSDQGRALQQAFCAAAQHWRELGFSKTGSYSAKPRSDRVAELEAWLVRQTERGLSSATQGDAGPADTGLDDGLGEGELGYEAVREQKLLGDYFHPGAFSHQARQVEGDSPPPSLPQPELLEAIADLVDGPAQLLLLHACHWGRRELRRRRQRAGVTSFAQLLEALDPGADAEAPGALLGGVAERYAVALIDEFQDTDPVQWRILRLAFGGGSHRLVMVGDPKQAIYRFRGGDLPTYLAARDRADACLGLRQNRRSSAALIAALNGLMAGPLEGDGQGLPRSGLAVPPVEAAADLEVLSADGQAVAPVRLLWLGGDRAAGVRLPSRSSLEAELPARIAAAVCRLLGQGLVLRQGEERRPLRREHLCILVSTHNQAESLRAALEARGLASRLVSKADVFASPAALALQRLLDALADPTDRGRLRLLAASPLLAWSAARIASTDDQGWSELASELERLARRLHRGGPIGVINALLDSEALARLALGGRLLADLQQLATLVQERLHADQLGPAAAADWLRRLRLDPDRLVPEEHQAHSDRVDGAIAVVTVHRSKGLEFPVVLCPYLWQAPGGGQRRLALRWQPSNNAAPRLSLHGDRRWGPGWQAARQTRLAEEAERERLAYVAVTRARQLLLLAWAPAAEQACNPLRPWLLPREPLAIGEPQEGSERSDGDWRQAIDDAIAARRLPIQLEDAPPPDDPIQAPPSPPTDQRWSCGPVPRRRLDSLWGRSSYTSWTRDSHGAAEPASSGDEGRDEGRDTADPSGDWLETFAGAERPDLEFLADPGAKLAQDRAAVPAADGGSPGLLAAGREAGGSAGEGADQTPGAAPGLGPAAAAAATSAGPAMAAAAGASGGSGAPSANAGPRSRLEWPRQGPLAQFPRGSGPGDCLHRILEQLDYQQAMDARENRLVAERELRRGGFLDQPLEPLRQGLEQLRLTPFGGDLGAWCLARLPRGQRLNELAFDLTLDLVRAADLAAVFAAYPGGCCDAAYAERLAALPVASRGFLTGSIDLTCPIPHRDGSVRWWVIDWKSNWLGERDGDGQPLACGPLHYQRGAMTELMLGCHYPLQAHLYLVALHRYLRWRLPGYAPERHLGGYAYVFLRGVPGPLAGLGAGAGPGGGDLGSGDLGSGDLGGGTDVPGVFLERPPLPRLLALERLFAGTQPQGAP